MQAFGVKDDEILVDRLVIIPPLFSAAQGMLYAIMLSDIFSNLGLSSNGIAGKHMTFSSTLYCDTCGGANRPQAMFCSACGRRLHAPMGSFSISQTLTGLLVPLHVLK